MHGTRRRQVTGILPLPVTLESTPVSEPAEIVTSATPSALSKVVRIKSALEQLGPVPACGDTYAVKC